MSEFPKYKIRHDGTNNTIRIMSQGKGVEFYAGPNMADFMKEFTADANRISAEELHALQERIKELESNLRMARMWNKAAYEQDAGVWDLDSPFEQVLENLLGDA
jgi:hypothetical protein